MPQDAAERQTCKDALEHYVKAQGQRLIGWRRVPTDAKGANIGPSAAATEPIVEQLLVAAGDSTDRSEFCRQLLLIRGAVPGAKGGQVVVRPSVKSARLARRKSVTPSKAPPLAKGAPAKGPAPARAAAAGKPATPAKAQAK